MGGSCLFGVVGYALQPLLKNIVGVLILGAPMQYEVLFKSEFYFDITYLPYYALTYIEESFSCFVGACFNVRIFNEINLVDF